MIENILALIQAVKTENNLRKFGLFYTGNQGHNDNFMVKVHFSALRSCDIYKNSEILSFIARSARRISFLSNAYKGSNALSP